MITHPIYTLLVLVAIGFVISITTPLHLAAGLIAIVAPVVIGLAGARAERVKGK